MTCPPLAIIQARLNSTRLPRKVLLPLAGKPILQHVYQRTVQAFGSDHTVVAIPDNAENVELADWLHGRGYEVFAWDGPENDVLGRFFHCAHRYRWHPDSVIVRVTADDPWKDPDAMKRVANGERLPVEIGAEAFTLAMLDSAYERTRQSDVPVEHLTWALFPTEPPPAPEGTWTVDTPEDYEQALQKAGHRARRDRWLAEPNVLTGPHRVAQPPPERDLPPPERGAIL